jgi:hypothetical protein
MTVKSAGDDDEVFALLDATCALQCGVRACQDIGLISWCHASATFAKHKVGTDNSSSLNLLESI